LFTENYTIKGEKMEKAISLEQIKGLRQSFLSDDKALLGMNSVTKSGIDNSSLSFDAPIKTPNVFSHEIKTGEVTSQNSSGRCWLFAATNVMRLEVMKNCDVETFELSQPYLFFWDKFEKANFFLESILDTLNEPQDSRIIDWLLKMPFNDGGQWDMVVAIVEKYGIIPKSVMPESHSSSNSRKMNKFLTLKARQFAKELRDGYKAGRSREDLAASKGAMLGDF
jgi:bleomycin hydrolase